MNANAPRPLDGIRVLEMGQLLAGPFAGCVLGYFGAEVIKIEPPRGDPIRGWRVVRDGTSLWWASLARNKKSVTLDLRHAEAQIVRPGTAQPTTQRIIDLTTDMLIWLSTWGDSTRMARALQLAEKD